MTTLTDKALRIVQSCETREHYECALKWLDLAKATLPPGIEKDLIILNWIDAFLKEAEC